MEFRLEPLETISLVDKLSKCFACEICEDGRISLITDNNIFVYTLMNYMNNEFGDMAFKKNVITLPKSSLRHEFNSDLIELLDNFADDDLYELMAELDINNGLEPTLADIKPLSLKWSPKGLCGSSYCAVAVLNNLYGLSIMEEYRDVTDRIDYRCVANVTKYIYEQACKDWEAVSAVIGELTAQEWKQRASGIRPIAYEWSHLINDTGRSYAILFVAHPSGSVTSWKVYRIGGNNSESEPLHFAGMLISPLKNVTSLYWKKLGKNVGALFLGNEDGNLAVIRITNMNTDTLNFEKEQIFGENGNIKRALHITSIDYLQYSFIITVFDMFLNIMVVQEDGTILDEVTYNTGTTANTGLSYFKENIMVLLTAEKLRKLVLSCENGKLQIKDECIAIDFDWTTYKSYGIVFSKNRMFLGILAYPCRLKDITRHPTPTKFFIYYDAAVSPLEVILSNTDKSLTEYWDYFEVLRLLSIKEKKFPWEGIQDLDYDKLTLTQLKSLRWISKLSEKVYNIVPKIKGYCIKPYILLHYLVTIQLVVQRMRKLLNSLSEQLSVFQLRSLDICNMFLKEMVLMKILEKCRIGERFLDDMIGVMEIANELEYPDMSTCFWCREKIIGPTCIPPHTDSRCSISMMQVYLTPGFKCPFCKCVSHIEIAKEYETVMCPYCDVPMYERYSPENVQIALGKSDELTRQQMELSLLQDIPNDIHSHMDGCTEMTESFEDIENDVEYMALSDSEEEENLAEKMSSLHKELCSNKSGNYSNDIQDDMEETVVNSDDQMAENDSFDDEERDGNDSDGQLTQKHCSDKEQCQSDDNLKETSRVDDLEIMIQDE